MATGLGFANTEPPMYPPINSPTTKRRFQLSFFQSYLKSEMLAGRMAAHICRKDDEMPNFLLPNKRSNGTVAPINGPATYHGQGS